MTPGPRGRAAAVALLALLVAPSAGRAAVVAGAPDGVRLEVRDRGRELCARIAPREDREDCERPPSLADEPWLLRSFGRRDQRVAGIVPSRAAAVELFYPGEPAPRRVATEAGPAYRGRFAGRARFFVIPEPLPDTAAAFDPAYVRLLDAAGQIVAASEPLFGERPLERGPVRRAVRGRPSLRLGLEGRSRLVASVIALERRERTLCAAVLRRGEPAPINQTCLTERELPPVFATERNSCDRTGRTLFGVTRPRARRVVARYGSGRRVAVRIRPVPASLGVRAGAFAVAVPETRRSAGSWRSTPGGGASELSTGDSRLFSSREFTLADALVSCGPRRALVVGSVPPGARSVTVTEPDGRVVQARIVDLQPRLGVRRRIFVVALPRDVGVARIRVPRRGNPALEESLRLPPAEAQCGYQSSVFLVSDDLAPGRSAPAPTRRSPASRSP